jgi:roadblock/LC7 domain-containing protein
VLLCAGCENNVSETPVAANQVANKTVLLATIADDGKSRSVDPSLALGLHAPQSTSVQPFFSRHGGGAAYGAEKDDKAFVVHNGRAGNMYDAVGAIALSPDGRRIAHGALVAGKWHMVVDGTEGAAFSTVKSPQFSPDGKHLAYQAMAGEKWYLIVDTTANAGTNTRFLDHQFSSDSGKIAYIDNADVKNRGRLVISDLAFAQQAIISTGVSLMVVDQAGTRLAAVSLREGKQQLVECGFDRPDSVKTGRPYAAIQNPAFGPDGVGLAYFAERDGRHIMVFNDREEALPDGGTPVEFPVVRPDQKAVGSIISVNNRVFFQHSFLGERKHENSYDEIGGLVYNRDGSVHAYSARKGAGWFIVANGVEGEGFDRAISPKFSPDGRFLVYRARKDGKRFVVVAKKSGKIIRQHPPYEQVFDVVFTADGKSVAYGVKDGQKLVWRVEQL